MKHALMIKIDSLKEDWVYVTTGSNISDIKPLLFDDSITAEDIAEEWRLTNKEQNVKVVPYPDE